MTYSLQANVSGTRHIEVTDIHLQTLHRYHLLDRLLDSSGIVDDAAVERLRLKVRSMLEAGACEDNSLLDLCLDVLYHTNMKNIALSQLIETYNRWVADGKAGMSEELAETDTTASAE